MHKALWIVLAALMFAGTASVVSTPTMTAANTDPVVTPGEGSYPTPVCMPGAPNCPK